MYYGILHYFACAVHCSSNDAQDRNLFKNLDLYVVPKYVLKAPYMLIKLVFFQGDQRSPGIIPLAVKDAFSIIQEVC